MRKLLILAGLCQTLIACNAGSSSSATTPICPVNAPLFTTTLGTQLINSWGSSVAYYSPTGGGGYTDVFLGAAYFTAAQYLSNAVLLPTVSPVTREGTQAIYDYFTNFLSHSPQMTNNPGTPQPGGPYETLAGCGYGVISGYYNFTYLDGSAPTNARYTFQFQYLAVPASVNVTVTGGTESGTVLTISQPAGWYIMLQNSATLPATTGVAANLLVPQ